MRTLCTDFVSRRDDRNLSSTDPSTVIVPIEPSRREALLALGGGLVAAMAGSTLAAPSEQRAEIIDTHVHLVEARFRGSRANPTPVKLAPFDPGNVARGREQLADLVARQMKEAGIAQALCMPSFDISDEDPLGIRETLAIASLVKGPQLTPVGLIHPERFDRGHLALVEKLLENESVRALKAYLGYTPYEPDGPGFRRYYQLAAKYHVPVILHTGDTWSRQAKLKYAHPLNIDALAVDHPSTKFVLAHFGNPWVLDAAEVVYKNDNVWADLSALLVGNAADFARLAAEGMVASETERVSKAIQWSESYDKFLFGSDWPLCPFSAYVDFVAKLVPEQHRQAVFSGNAKKLYRL
jgi:predicted TIM-barrel fold metal-dependent hydrolase